MAIKYAELRITIHNLDTDIEALKFLTGYLHEATKACLCGKQKQRFNFEPDFEHDIEVEIEYTAGS